jgi:hypothetical protein
VKPVERLLEAGALPAAELITGEIAAGEEGRRLVAEEVEADELVFVLEEAVVTLEEAVATLEEFVLVLGANDDCKRRM